MPPPADLAVEPVRIPESNPGGIAAWWVQADPERAAVVLLHAIRVDRRSMLGRARLVDVDAFPAVYRVVIEATVK